MPAFKKLLVSQFTVPCAVESTIIGFLFSKTVLVLVKFAFVVVILEFIFTKLLFSSESLKKEERGKQKNENHIQ